jgi:hypothetical protein
MVAALSDSAQRRYDNFMATYLKHDDAYQWQLDLSPQAVVSLLKATCVDLGEKDCKRQYVKNLLWGPRSWGITFDDSRLVLTPLDHGVWQRIFGCHHGSIAAAKTGSVVQITFNAPIAERRLVRALVLTIVACIGVGGATLVALNQFWIGLILVAALCSWFAFAFLWLAPTMARVEPVRFLDQAFGNHCLPDDPAVSPRCK